MLRHEGSSGIRADPTAPSRNAELLEHTYAGRTSVGSVGAKTLRSVVSRGGVQGAVRKGWCAGAVRKGWCARGGPKRVMPKGAGAKERCQRSSAKQ